MSSEDDLIPVFIPALVALLIQAEELNGSPLTRNQVIAFILAVVVCFIFLLAGYPVVLDWFSSWLPQAFVDAVASLSFQRHFDSISKGVIDVRDLLYFAMLIALFLLATAITLDVRKAE